MLEKKLFISENISDSTHIFSTDLLKFLNNQDKGWRLKQSKSLLLIKKRKGISIRELIEENDFVEGTIGASNLLKQELINWDNFMSQDEVVEFNDVFKRMIRVFIDKDFTGAILFNLELSEFKKKNLCGDPVLLKRAQFYVPFFQMSIPIINDDWEIEHSSTYGLFSLIESVQYNLSGTGQTALSFERMDITLEEGEIIYTSNVCRLLLPELLSSQIKVNKYVLLYGSYESFRCSSTGQIRMMYHFILLSKTDLFPEYSALYYATIESIETLISFREEDFTLSINCTGHFYFQKASKFFDPFSYGKDYDNGIVTSSSKTLLGEGLPFRNLTYTYIIKGNSIDGISANYRNLTIHPENAKPRGNSFFSAFSSKDISLVSWETASHPEKLGYTQIIVPTKQSLLTEKWYGLTISIPIVKDVNLKLLFAWCVDKKNVGFYAGGRVEAFGISKQLKINVGSLFQVGFQSVTIHSKEFKQMSEKSQIIYSISLNGLSVGMLGLSMPQSSPDITLIGKNNKDENSLIGWVSAYEKRRI